MFYLEYIGFELRKKIENKSYQMKKSDTYKYTELSIRKQFK